MYRKKLLEVNLSCFKKAGTSGLLRQDTILLIISLQILHSLKILLVGSGMIDKARFMIKKMVYEDMPGCQKINTTLNFFLITKKTSLSCFTNSTFLMSK